VTVEIRRTKWSAIYSININFKSKYQLNYIFLQTLNDIIQLKVPAYETNKERVYSYSQLVELHDKLTLVISKEEEQQHLIKYFEDVSYIPNLTKWYILFVRIFLL
jgi:hypothetical protein